MDAIGAFIISNWPVLGPFAFLIAILIQVATLFAVMKGVKILWAIKTNDLAHLEHRLSRLEGILNGSCLDEQAS